VLLSIGWTCSVKAGIYLRNFQNGRHYNPHNRAGRIPGGKAKQMTYKRTAEGMIGLLMEQEKYKFVDWRVLAEIVRDVYKVQDTDIDGLERGIKC
jgi:hypothetical protein